MQNYEHHIRARWVAKNTFHEDTTGSVTKLLSMVGYASGFAMIVAGSFLLRGLWAIINALPRDKRRSG